MDERTQLLHSLAIDRTAPRAVRPRRRFLLAIVAVAVILAAGGAAIVWQLSTSALPVAAVPPPGPPPAPPPATTASQSRALVASGYVVARRKATIASEITGKVVELRVDEGNVVEAGQILAQLDSSIAETDLALAQSRALASQAAVGAIAADLRDAERIFDRTQTLSQKNFATEADLTKAEARVGVLRAQLNQSQAQRETARLDAQRAAKVLEQHRIRAPFAGVVIERSAQPGEMISPMSAGGSFTRTGICTVVDMDSLEIEVDVNESYINRVQTKQAVEATLDAYSDWKIPAKVIAIIPTSDRQKSTVKVRIGFDKLDPRILPEMSIKVAFEQMGGSTASGTRAIVVPKGAIQN